MSHCAKTECCAMMQLRAYNDTTRESIEAHIETQKNNGRKAMFCIAMPDEEALKSNLEKLGFEPIAKFPRMNHHDGGDLTMYFKVIAQQERPL